LRSTSRQKMATTTSMDLLSGSIDILIMRYENRNFNGIVRSRFHDFLKQLQLAKPSQALPPFTPLHINLTSPSEVRGLSLSCYSESRAFPRTLHRLPCPLPKKYLSPLSSPPSPLPPLINNLNHTFVPTTTPRTLHLGTTSSFILSSFFFLQTSNLLPSTIFFDQLSLTASPQTVSSFLTSQLNKNKTISQGK
jgi:hypothetical protein